MDKMQDGIVPPHASQSRCVSMEKRKTSGPSRNRNSIPSLPAGSLQALKHCKTPVQFVDCQRTRYLLLVADVCCRNLERSNLTVISDCKQQCSERKFVRCGVFLASWCQSVTTPVVNVLCSPDPFMSGCKRFTALRGCPYNRQSFYINFVCLQTNKHQNCYTLLALASCLISSHLLNLPSSRFSSDTHTQMIQEIMQSFFLQENFSRNGHMLHVNIDGRIISKCLLLKRVAKLRFRCKSPRIRSNYEVFINIIMNNVVFLKKMTF